MERSPLVEQILNHAKSEYHAKPELLWRTNPTWFAFRRGEKSFAVILDAKRSSLGLDGEGWIDLLEVRCEPEVGAFLRHSPGFCAARQMGKEHWIAIMLDGNVPWETICSMLKAAYESLGETAPAKKSVRSAHSGPISWVIPSNPQQFDVFAEFRENDEVCWHYANDIRVGDTVYIYVTAPYSAIMFACSVTETDIPYHSKNPARQKWKKQMRLKLKSTYTQDEWPRSRTMQYGLGAVRGARTVPAALAKEIEQYDRRLTCDRDITDL